MHIYVFCVQQYVNRDLYEMEASRWSGEAAAENGLGRAHRGHYPPAPSLEDYDMVGSHLRLPALAAACG